MFLIDILFDVMMKERL